MPLFILGAGLVFVLDRTTKVLAVQFLDGVSTIPVWPGVFHLTLVRNTGVAFGFFKNAGPFFAVLSVFSAAAIFFYLWKILRPVGRMDWARYWAWAALAGGAMGNAYDRIRFGSVIDFLDFRVWPVFNLADSAIVCGAAMVAAAAYLKKV